MRFKPFIAVRGRHYSGRLNVLGFGAEAITEVTADFATPQEALRDLLRRLDVMFQSGDSIEVRGVVFYSLADAEAELKASLPP